MNIIFTPEVALKLQTFARIYPKEFSGFGFINREDESLTVYDIIMLDVGSEVYTEIDTKKVLAMMQRKDAAKMKLWFHKHPIDFWSGTDEHTIQTAPLGGVPELVRWSASVVLTPRGWIGRVDNHITHKTAVAEVSADYTQWATENLDRIISEKAARNGKWVKVSRPKKAKKEKAFSTTRYLQGRFANDELEPDWELQWPDDEDERVQLFQELEDLAEEGEENEEAEIVDEEELDISFYERRNSNLRQSKWYERLFGL